MFNHKNPVVSGMISLILLTVMLFLFHCSKEPTEPNGNTNQKLKENFQRQLDHAVASDTSIHNAVLLVEAPLINLKWQGAAGMADPGTNLAMLPDDQFRVASLGKMTLATLVMKLMEEGRFSLDDSIYHYLPDSIITGLHVLQGVDYSNQITVRQLLNHTTGLPDYIQDGNRDENGLTDFLKLLIAQPAKFWTPEETIAYTKQYLLPVFIPGGGYHYSDTNYQLLGLILQNVTSQALHLLYREKIFAPLGMDHTYMEYYDNPIPSIPGRSISHIYLGDFDYTSWISNSADWAGGGLISTSEDLNRFLRAFVNNGIFQNTQTRQTMLEWISTGDPGIYYGLGIARINLEEFGMAGFGEIYGHEGFAQSFMYYWPKRDVTLVGTLNQAVSDYHYQQLVLEVIGLLNQ